jgi:hypothetical protein
MFIYLFNSNGTKHSIWNSWYNYLDDNTYNTSSISSLVYCFVFIKIY